MDNGTLHTHHIIIIYIIIYCHNHSTSQVMGWVKCWHLSCFLLDLFLVVILWIYAGCVCIMEVELEYDSWGILRWALWIIELLYNYVKESVILCTGVYNSILYKHHCQYHYHCQHHVIGSIKLLSSSYYCQYYIIASIKLLSSSYYCQYHIIASITLLPSSHHSQYHTVAGIISLSA